MIRRAIVLTAAVIVAAACSHLRPSPQTPARRDFLAGVDAHRRGADDEAAADWARCSAEAAPGGQDAQDCAVSSELLKELNAAKSAQNAAVPAAAAPAPAPAPKARPIAPSPVDALHRAEQSYLEGVVYYQNADWEKARSAWKKCSRVAPFDSEVASDCRAGLAKLAEQLGEQPAVPLAGSGDAAARAQQAYLEGVVYYQKGDYIKASAAWKKCADLAIPGTDGADDCRAGLDRLDKLYGITPAPADDKK